MKSVKAVVAVVLVQATLLTATQSTRDLPTARQQFNSRRFKEAADIYSALAVISPNLSEAHVGLIHTRLALDDVRGAMDAARDGLKAVPNSASVTAAAGDVQFRVSQFDQALALYQRALQLDPNLGRAWWGLGRIEMISWQKKSAREHFIKAHALAPQDTDIVLSWAWTGESPEKIALGLEQYAAIASFLPKARVDLLRDQIATQKYLGQNNACVLASQSATNSMKLRRIQAPPALFDTYSPSFRVNASLGKAKAGNFRLAGDREILLSPAYAKKAGIARVPNSNKSSKNYVGIADNLKIGGLEFQNCVVRVSASLSGGGGISSGGGFPGGLSSEPMPGGIDPPDGVLGLGLFLDFLITLDFEKDELRLEPMGSSVPGGTTRWTNRDDAVDRKDFMPMLQIGQDLGIPIRVNSSQPLLFVLRLGGNTSVLATELAKQILQQRWMVYAGAGPCSVNCISFELGSQQANATLMPTNLSGPSFDIGIKVDGLLGTNVLRQFVVTIDARNGFIKLDKLR